MAVPLARPGPGSDGAAVAQICGAWLRRKVRQRCEGGRRRAACRYRRTVAEPLRVRIGLLKALTESAGEFVFDAGREVELKGISEAQRVRGVEWR